MPTLLSEFTALHPAVRPEVVTADSAAVIAELRAERADIGFVEIRAASREVRDQAVMDDEVVLAVPGGHPFAAPGKRRYAARSRLRARSSLAQGCEVRQR